ncbi:tRNA uridine-5-carboxymethylaminomethyl(34) synthesis enzyme MnmG, partial [bacterium]
MRDFYDIVVVGGGHSGVEAAFSAHKFGLSVALVSKSKKSLGRMSCNPSIGGLAKSRVVREVDALGGVLPRAADMSATQYRVLNRRKGPAVQSTRAQCDRKKYELSVQKILDENSNVAIIEGSASELIIEDGKIVGVVLSSGERIGAEAVVLATGTFLGGKIFIGDVEYPGGRIDENAETGLSESLKKMGLKILRFKTGTPPRIDGRTINYDNVRIQPGEEDYVPFSFDTMRKIPVDEQVPCYITYTTERTHRIIEKNLLKSALYGGKIVGIGPRYCPSIEVKVEKFPHHPRHIVFLEPEGIDTDEFYPNGVSNSLPEEVQLEMLRSIPGLEDVEMTKPGYAVEYDVVEPTQVLPTLELRDYKKIFLAGQILGTSGYEEAAGLGLLAGTNAALSVLGKDMITLPRYASYTGVMVDDLVFRGAD